MSTAPKPPRQTPPRQIIGWRETVALPDLGIARLKAKIDTGARTSALHATRIRVFRQDGAAWVEFHLPAPGTPREARLRVPLLDSRAIRNTGGVAETRHVIRTTLVLGARSWPIEVSLANRTEMSFDLILGRTAIRGRRLLVDPGRSALAGPPALNGESP
jgi:hypothetical protein